MSDFQNSSSRKVPGPKTIKKGNIIIKPMNKYTKLEFKKIPNKGGGASRFGQNVPLGNMKAFSPQPQRFNSNYEINRNK